MRIATHNKQPAIIGTKEEINDLLEYAKTGAHTVVNCAGVERASKARGDRERINILFDTLDKDFP